MGPARAFRRSQLNEMGSSSPSVLPSGPSPSGAASAAAAACFSPTISRMRWSSSTISSGVRAKELLGVLPALAQLLALVGVPGTGLLHDAEVDRDVEDRAFPADALAVDDVELGVRNGGAHLFFTTFTRVRLPITSVPSLIDSTRRMSRRTEE